MTKPKSKTKLSKNTSTPQNPLWGKPKPKPKPKPKKRKEPLW